MNDEKYLEKKLRQEVEKIGGIAIKFFPVSFTGFPDRVVLMPGGKIWFVEIKSKGKKPSPRQLAVLKMLDRLGFKTYVIDTNELLENLLNEL